MPVEIDNSEYPFPSPDKYENNKVMESGEYDTKIHRKTRLNVSWPADFDVLTQRFFQLGPPIIKAFLTRRTYAASDCKCSFHWRVATFLRSKHHTRGIDEVKRGWYDYSGRIMSRFRRSKPKQNYSLWSIIHGCENSCWNEVVFNHTAVFLVT